MKDSVTVHADEGGISRSEWVRRAINEKLVSERIHRDEHLTVDTDKYEGTEGPSGPHRKKSVKDAWWL
jgi:hypothetical protein